MKDRLEVLKDLLNEGALSTQDELRRKLEKMQYPVTQSTISRDLRRIGAVRALGRDGETVYRLLNPAVMEKAAVSTQTVRSIQANNAMVVIHTAPGAASMVARHIDMHRPPEVLGTIAGDDTIFVAIAAQKTPATAVASIRALVSILD